VCAARREAEPELDEHGVPLEDPQTGEVLVNEWNWSMLLRKGFVEYVDTEEEEMTMIAMTIKDLEVGCWGVRLWEGAKGGTGLALGLQGLRARQGRVQDGAGSTELMGVVVAWFAHVLVMLHVALTYDAPATCYTSLPPVPRLSLFTPCRRATSLRTPTARSTPA
jgi:hypothetical protein